MTMTSLNHTRRASKVPFYEQKWFIDIGYKRVSIPSGIHLHLLKSWKIFQECSRGPILVGMIKTPREGGLLPPPLSFWAGEMVQKGQESLLCAQ